MSKQQESFKLNNGASIPAIGLGTWKSKPGEVEGAVMEALKIGYKAIDCAATYANEEEVGKAFSETFKEGGSVKRSDVFITSKLWNSQHKAEDVRPAFEKTLSDLKCEYLDLYLIHWPIAQPPGEMKFDDNKKLITADISIKETWQAMEQLLESSGGKLKAIGVSNFTIPMLQDLLTYAKVVPAANQVEHHPYLNQDEMLNYCSSKGIHVTSYSPLGTADSKAPDAPSLVRDELIEQMGKKYNKSPAQILLRWGIQKGTNVIPKSVHPERLAQNLNVFDFKISDEDMNEISNLSKSKPYRFCDPKRFWKIELFQ